MSDLNATTRRRFMTYFASVGLGSTLAPGIVWARMQDAGTRTITLAMITEAMKLSGIELTEAELKGDGRRGQPEPEALRRGPRDSHPERRLAAVSLQPDRAGAHGEQEGAAVRVERAAGGEASGAPRGRGVLADPEPRRARAHATGHLARADRDVSRAPASLQRPAQQRRHLPRRLRPRRSEARRRRDRGRQIQGTAARHSVGREGHHLGHGIQDDVGIAGLQGAVVRLRRQRRRDAARCGRGADREAHDRRARQRRSVVRRTDQEPVGSDAGLERIVGGALVGDGGRLRRLRASAPRPADRF